MKYNSILLFICVVSILYSQSTIPDKADISVNNIYLCDTLSVQKIIHYDIEKYLQVDDVKFPHLNVANYDTSELLVLIFHPGSISWAFDEFQITKFPNDLNEKYLILKDVKKFITGKGIKLGIKEKEMERILGKNYLLRKHPFGKELLYSISNLNSSIFLKEFNLTEYLGKYNFRNGKLTYIKFGFLYP